MTCETEWPGDGPPLQELPGLGPELVIAFPAPCRRCASTNLGVEGLVRYGPDMDTAPLAELAEHPAELQAWLRCKACGQLDHRQSST